jgi:acetyl esterase/lipase
MSMPWIFLVVSVIGALFTLNAHLPTRPGSRLGAGSFFAGWLTSEMPLHHIAWQLLASFGFAAAGALEAWPGWLGLALTLGSWMGMLALLPPALEARGLVATARAAASGVSEESGTGHEPLRVPFNPFALRDSRIQRTGDIAYVPGGGPRQQLDVYRLATGVEDAPVLLQIHGGAWVIGEKRQQGLPLMMELARRGWVCVAINYRLSPRHAWPAHLEDCKQALAWIQQNIRSFGGDPGFVAVTGGSAGGHLSSLVALTENDPRYQEGFEAVDTRVAACVPFYGVYDWTHEADRHYGSGLRQMLGRMVVQQPYEEAPERYREASPIHRIHSDLPPFLVVHGRNDSLAPVDGAREFVERLKQESKSPVGYAELPGAQHAFDVFHSLRSRDTVLGVSEFLEGVHARYRSGRTREGRAVRADD